jgi:signal transduction histidine kinase
VADLIAHSVDAVTGVADEAEVAIETEFEDLEVDADLDRAVQALVNLLGNAVKFSPGGSRVTVSAGRAGASALISVRDEGRGIPEEKLGEIFERFTQVDASDARERGGTGLGLAIARSFVELNGGRIWAESRLGAGSIFRFTLPLVSDNSRAGEGVRRLEGVR